MVIAPDEPEEPCERHAVSMFRAWADAERHSHVPLGEDVLVCFTWSGMAPRQNLGVRLRRRTVKDGVCSTPVGVCHEQLFKQAFIPPLIEQNRPLLT